jgi:hypothetical protein
MLKNLITKFLFGGEPADEPLDLTNRGPRIAYTVGVEDRPDFNEFWQRIHALNKENVLKDRAA